MINPTCYSEEADEEEPGALSSGDSALQEGRDVGNDGEAADDAVRYSQVEHRDHVMHIYMPEIEGWLE